MKRLVCAALFAAATGFIAASAHAAPCIKAGGWGTGALQGFASFMAEAAMKNSAKAKLGDAVKIGPASTKCEIKGSAVRVRSLGPRLQVGRRVPPITSKLDAQAGLPPR